MFHLFDKVYLEFDHYLSAYENRIVISQNTAAEVGETAPVFGTQHAWGKTVEDVIGVGKVYPTFLDFFKQIKTTAADSKLIVYCDRVALQHLFIAWHKLLLNVDTPDNLWKIWKLFVDKESYASTITQSNAPIFFNSIKVGSWNKEDFDSKFSSTSIVYDAAWHAEIINSLGIEYLLTTHLLNNSTTVSASLKNKIQLLSKRMLKGELYDTKLSIISNSFNKTFHDALGIPQPATVSDIFSNPELEIFSDSKIWIEDGRLVTANQGDSLKIELLTESDIDSIITAFNLIRQNFQKLQADSVDVTKINWLHWANTGMTDSQLDDLLVDVNFSATNLIDSSDTDNINMLFIDWILALHRTGNINSVSDLSISLN